MCSIAAIPSEHILGHSPPVYGPLIYSSLMVTTPPITTRSVPPRIRPCLSTGSIQLDGFLKGSDDLPGSTSTRRKKKSVVFADDRGRPLTYVRVMSEPSNVPPLWTSSYVAKLARGDIFQFPDDPAISRLANHLGGVSLGRSSSEPSSPDALDSPNSPSPSPPGSPPTEPQVWEVYFAQPASDYLAFRNKLERNSVCLENVIVRESERQIVGTVKVKNLAYDKRVSVRHTCDNWASYLDAPCSYVEQPGLAAQQSPVKNLYDTFRFQIALPVLETNANNSNSNNTTAATSLQQQQPTRLEFCVRFQTPECEFWDNNESKNYAISKRRDVTSMPATSVNPMPSSEQQSTASGSTVGNSDDNIVNENNNSNNHNNNNSSLGSALSLTPPMSSASRDHHRGHQSVQMRTWSEFASWQHHAETDSPYW